MCFAREKREILSLYFGDGKGGEETGDFRARAGGLIELSTA